VNEKRSAHDDLLTKQLYDQFQTVIEEFQSRADKLSAAYESMQEQFKKVNIELDSKNAELAQSLRKQQEVQNYLNSILESMYNGVIGVDVLGTITHFNRAASQITGLAVHDVLHKPYSDFFEYELEKERSLLSVLRTGKVMRREEKVLWHKDGHPVQVSFQTAMLRDAEGRVLGAVEILSDISRIKQLEEEMQQTRTMAAIGEMAATVAHEIRNPLGAMGVWAGILERDLDANDTRRKTVRKIIEGLSRLNRIVSNLLVYARPVKAQFRKVDISRLLAETVDFVEIEIERQRLPVTVTKALGENNTMFVNADPEKLQQVIMNLCLNAIQAMSTGGTLTVGTDRQGKKTGNVASFYITDTGNGIPKESVDKVFDPFYTTKENGTGLGLAIVKKIIEFHSGHLDLNSSVGKGTTVRVFFPAIDRDESR
jgi:PAS domain S-box-containing protein